MTDRAAGVVHELVSDLDYPMFIVTATNGREKSGCLVGFATQCSINPPRFLVCLSDKNRTFRVARDASVVVVHLVPAEADSLAQLFGSQTGDEIDKFEHCAWHEGPEGTPVLDECGNWFAGRIVDRVEAGDHCALLLDPFDAHSDDSEEAFTFHRAKRIEPGHEA
ncbi:MAG TPA: flavin reductase family protein [Solirubrobacteraceae bacterium]|jgi:flavin reductase (DIM6/NTAB) family NADH-FMN oxidoreductase RutF